MVEIYQSTDITNIITEISCQWRAALSVMFSLLPKEEVSLLNNAEQI